MQKGTTQQAPMSDQLGPGTTGLNDGRKDSPSNCQLQDHFFILISLPLQ